MADVRIAQAPTPSWEQEFFTPAFSAANVNTGTLASWWFKHNGSVGDYNPEAASTNVIDSLRVWFGRPACRANNNTAGVIYTFPWWFPSFGPALDQAPGSRVPEHSVVAVFDFGFAFNSPLIANWAVETTGLWFVPQALSTGLIPAPNGAVLGGGSQNGCFGIAAVDDGAGGMSMDFITFGPGGFISRINAPAGFSPLTEWNNARIQIISAGPGREANVSAWLNGDAWVTELPFDDITLLRPTTTSSRAVGLGVMPYQDSPAGARMYWTLHGRWGRSTPLGVPVQTP